MTANISELFVVILFIVGSFLVGAIPSGYVIAKLKGIGDIRAFGSGNIGASNVGRVLGLKYFLLVFFVDALKSALMFYWASQQGFIFFSLTVVACALLLGNCYSPFLHWQGGKGVATFMGIIAVFSPFCMSCGALMWLAIYAFTRIPAHASFAALGVMLGMSYFYISSAFFPFLLYAVCLIGWRHKSNVQMMYKVK
jgi:glycerol-3-phosphate acyltransferase PlsY